MPQGKITNKVLEVVSKLPHYPNLKVLDVSCGEGVILSRLQKDGCRVIGTHYKENDYIIKQSQHLDTLDICKEVDLHSDLPFSDNEFDLVINTEVVEHLRSHIHLIHEIGRVVKPGGYMILTTPNISRLHSRWQFFMTGTHKLIRENVHWGLNKDDLYAYHINPIDFVLLHTVLFQAGMKIKNIFFTRCKLKHLYWFLFYPLYYLYTKIDFAVLQ